MGNLHLDLPDELHKRLKLEAVQQGIPLKQHVMKRLKEQL